MASAHRVIAALAAAALGAGCFGYNPSAKRWAYVGDAVLIAGGGAAIALDLTSSSGACMPVDGRPCAYDAPVGGALVAGAVLAAAGVVGLVLNATRPTVKTSR